MWCLTKQESQTWCEERGFPLDAAGHPVITGRKHSVTASLADMNWSRLTSVSRFIASYLEPFDRCLLWVTLWGVWSSSENLQLFYRLRESYGERRQLHDAPGHLFLSHEGADLASFIQLALQFGWDFYLLPTPDYHTAFVSHDEFVEFHSDDLEAAKRAQERLGEASRTSIPAKD
ncbi:MAG TPA: hypothetical protein VGQ11_00425 [Candidatus Acidoferrales bacterium]|jgi:hypothetical protein|nr:hypothetical protein [Candidatus Acidoferrales bacterium]